jgi:superfamily II DNA or RNA helicase
MTEKYRIVISPVCSQLIPLEPSRDIFLYLYDLLSYDVQNSYFIKALSKKKYVQQQWDGKQHLFSKVSGKFLTGHLPLVLEALDSNSIPYEIEDLRPIYEKGKPLQLVDVEERDYQKEAVEAILKYKRGRIWARIRSGKTIMMIMTYAKLNISPFVIICQSIDIVYQTKEKFQKFLPQVPVGIVGDGQCDIQLNGVTITTIQSLASAFDKKYKLSRGEKKEKSFKNLLNKKHVRELIRDTKFIWVDESHHIAQGNIYSDVLKNIEKAEYVIGGSGTPFREDNTDLYTEGLIGPLIFEISYSDLIKGGFLVAPTIHLIKVPKNIESSKDDYSTIYKECVVENEYRNDIIKRVVENLISRNKSSMVLVSKIKHGKILQELISDSVFLQGDDDSDLRTKTFQDLRDKKLLCLITTLGDEGLDIQNLDAVVIASGGKSAIKAFQRLRCMTPYKTETEEKTAAIVVDFIDPYKYLKTHSNKRKRLYKTEPLFKIVVKDVKR